MSKVNNAYGKAMVVLGGLLAGVPSFAEIKLDDASNSLSGSLNNIETNTKTTMGSILSIGGWILVGLGVVFFFMGAYKVFIDEDKRDEGKAAKGVKQMVGGIIFAAFFGVVTWVLGKTG